MAEENNPLPPVGDKIVRRLVEEEMKTAYVNYAMSVIVGRALPDVRDGLKPVHRRILYAMQDLGMFHNKPFKKCARIVGEVLGKYHPHGDLSVYDALVRMAQDFSLRYPLIKGQGNFGCFTGDTKVKLVDGRELSFLELTKEDKQGKKNYTFTVNSKGEIEIAEIKNPRLTKKKQELVKITLDSGSEIRCTLNHQFMLRDGTYREAQQLKRGDSLLPLNLKLSIPEDGFKPALVGYRLVHQPNSNQWISCHALADNWNLEHGMYAKSSGRIRHHVDFNRMNNNPENIRRIGWKEHWKIHAEHASKLHENSDYCKKIAEGRNKFWSKDENRKKAADRMSKKNKENWSNNEYRAKMSLVLSKTNLKFCLEHPEIRKKHGDRLKRLWKDNSYRKKMSILKSEEMKKRWKQNDPSLRKFTSEESNKIWANPKHRTLISENSKKLWENESYKEERSKQSKELWNNKEYRSKFSKAHFSEAAKKLWDDPKTKELHCRKARLQWENIVFRKKIINGVKIRNQKRLEEDPGFMHRLTEKAKLALHDKWKDPSYKEKVMKSRILGYVNSLVTKYPKVTPHIYEKERYDNCLPRLNTALHYFKDFSEMVEQARLYNHKVANIEFLNEKEDVYDLTIDGTHNFALAAGIFVHNSVDGDNPAAMRYTEAKLNKLAEEMLKDLDKNTVNFRDNFDGSLKEPEVLPSKIPNLLINGSTGIAVGMATSVPPHNIKEVCRAVAATIDNPEISAEELINIIPGPDFPTGGEVFCGPALEYAYRHGKGKVTIRSVVEIEGDKIIVKEIPYMVNKAEMIEQIAEMVRDKKIPGIRNLNDESDQDGVRIVIEVKKDVDPQVVLNQLYEFSRLRVSFGLTMLALVNNEPKLLGLKEFLQHHISHRKEVLTRRTQYDLEEARKKVHLLDGLLIALEHIDEVVPGIKNSKTVEEAQQFLMRTYSLTELQAKAILEMRLQKLASLEQEKIRTEHQELNQKIAYYLDLLASEQKILGLIKEEMREIQENYGDERKSKIIRSTEEEELVDLEELIEEEKVIVTFTHAGYVKRLATDTYRTQKRGGKGMKATEMKEEDFVEKLYVASTHDHLLFFTDQGQVYWLKVYHLPEGSRQAKGKHISNLIEMQPGERITAVIPVRNFTEGYLFMATKLGTVKKTELMEFSNPRKGGIRAISLDEGDTLVGVRYTDGKKEMLLATKNGAANRFSEEDVRSMGRVAGGVRGIRLEENDEVVGMLAAEEGKQILTLTEKGYGKRTAVSEYRLCNRGGKGVANIKITDKNGPVKTVMLVEGKEELMIVSKNGIGIRVRCADISEVGRATQGVRVIRLEGDDQLVAAAEIVPEENGNEVISNGFSAAPVEIEPSEEQALKPEENPEADKNDLEKQ